MRLLDLFSGAGGAAYGYHLAGFDKIVGIDIVDQPDYPFDFIREDATRCDEGSNFYLRDFDLIHASPPCQDYSPMSNRWGSDHPRLIPVIRETLERARLPYVIENVQGAGSDMISPITLTGEMFGLTVHRPRLFELGGWFAMAPAAPKRNPDALAVYGKPDGRWLWERTDGSKLHAWSSLEQGQEALEVPWDDIVAQRQGGNTSRVYPLSRRAVHRPTRNTGLSRSRRLDPCKGGNDMESTRPPLVEHPDRPGIWVRESSLDCPMCGGPNGSEHEDCRPW